MRVTNAMLVSNLMRNLNNNLTRMDSLNNQLSTGRKFANISDDPSSLIYSQSARNKLVRIEHYQRTVQTAQDWLRQAEAGVMEMQLMFVNAYEEAVNAATDGKTDGDKQNIAQVIGQMRNHFVDTLNSTFGDKYVFGGYNTPGDPAGGFGNEGIKTFTVRDNQLYYNGFNISQFDGMPAALMLVDLSGRTPAEMEARLEAIISDPNGLNGNPATFFADNGFSFDMNDLVMMHRLKNDVLSFDVGPGISMPVTINGIDLVLMTTTDKDGNAIVRGAFDMLQELFEATNGVPDAVPPKPPLHANDISKLIKGLRDGQNHLLTRNSEIGGRVNRLDLLESRYEQDEINYERMRSDAEDVDAAEVIMHLKMAEAIYQAALSAGARIIQPTLMDFLR